MEGAEPDVARDQQGIRGILASALNFMPTPAGKLAVRGGTSLQRSFTDGSSNPISRMLTLAPYTPTGAVVAGFSSALSKHYLWRLTSDMAFYTGVEATSRIDLTAAPSTAWSVAAEARPVMAELFEKMFICDANATAGSRHTLLAVDSTGVVQEPQFNISGGLASLRPYCLEEFNNVLFVAGYDSNAAPNAPEMVRHSFLGRDPASATGFDADAYNIIGAKGQRVTAMRKGKNLLLVSKSNELYRVTGAGRGRAGWQYAVDRVSSSLGLGASNPLALTFADPYWYGIGFSGPFRTNGFTIEAMVLPRRLSWNSVTNVDKAFVAHHPDRQVIVFGVNRTPAPAGYSTTYPYEFWIWDIVREAWVSDMRVSAGIFYMAGITTVTAQAPAAVPGLPAVTDSAAGLTSVRITPSII